MLDIDEDAIARRNAEKLEAMDSEAAAIVADNDCGDSCKI
ncbi:hypothetical protein ACVFDQ_002747 [Enterobacter hormaechei]